MALWFDLRINNDPRIGQVEIRRCEPLDLTDPAAIADVVSTYTVRRDTAYVGTVRHRYGDGAWKLLALAADLIAQSGPETAPESTHAAQEGPASGSGCTGAQTRSEALADSDGFCDGDCNHGGEA